MGVTIDKNTCIGCGACAALCPDAFEVGAEGKAHVKTPYDCSKCDCKAAADGCPVGAIKYTP